MRQCPSPAYAYLHHLPLHVRVLSVLSVQRTHATQQTQLTQCNQDHFYPCVMPLRQLRLLRTFLRSLCCMESGNHVLV